jgi:hypothetical protein
MEGSERDWIEVLSLGYAFLPSIHPILSLHGQGLLSCFLLAGYSEEANKIRAGVGKCKDKGRSLDSQSQMLRFEGEEGRRGRECLSVEGRYSAHLTRVPMFQGHRTSPMGESTSVRFG